MARAASGMVHNVKVLSAASTDASSSGSDSPSSPTNWMGTEDSATRAADSLRPTSEGSTAKTVVTSAG